MLSDILAVCLFAFLLWYKLREGNRVRDFRQNNPNKKTRPKSESNCGPATSQTACRSAGGTGTTCYWCSESGGGKCVNGNSFAGPSPPNCKS